MLEVRKAVGGTFFVVDRPRDGSLETTVARGLTNEQAWRYVDRHEPDRQDLIDERIKNALRDD